MRTSDYAALKRQRLAEATCAHLTDAEIAWLNAAKVPALDTESERVRRAAKNYCARCGGLHPPIK